MTNEIKTRRLIVALPNTSGDEADAMAMALEYEAGERQGVEGATVTHALGETLPDDLGVRRFGTDVVIRDLTDGDQIVLETPLAMRQLAGALLANADEIEGN